MTDQSVVEAESEVVAIADNQVLAVETVSGAVAPADLGPTLIGEQIVLAPAGHGYWRLDDQAAERIVGAAAEALTQAHAAGIASVVDVTPIESGRDTVLLARIAERAGVSIVFSTGLDAEGRGVSRAFRALSPMQLADVFIAELSEGVPGTAARAGAIAVTHGETVSEFDDGVGLAAAFAHAETGAPLLASATGERVVGLVDSLVRRGADPERVVACGLDSPAVSWSTVEELGKRGVMLGFNWIAEDVIHEDARAALVAYALRRYGPTRVCVGSGAPAARLGVPGQPEQPVPSGGYATFLDRLASFGAPAELVTEAAVETARALFAPLREA